MPYTSEPRSHSILETSLTELAFIFFFILAIFATWKVNNSTEELNRQVETNNKLSTKVSELSNTLKSASELLSLGAKIDPNELFNELSKGKAAVAKLESIQDKNVILEKKLNDITSLLDKENKGSVQDIVKKVKEYEKIVNILKENPSHNGENTLEKIKNLADNFNDLKGQNTNLRNKLKVTGNGLDHPPCWANPIDGSIQYVFKVVINETNIRIFPGWPSERNNQATSNNNIMKIPGTYSSNTQMWEATDDLFEESKKQSCRHFVRIYDNSDSKKSFKSYLIGIETHFYKYLSNEKYNEN